MKDVDRFLCESLIDALPFWRAGYHNVTASYGVEGFTAEHLTALKDYRTQRVLNPVENPPRAAGRNGICARASRRARPVVRE
jgi:hypothetical protein